MKPAPPNDIHNRSDHECRPAALAFRECWVRAGAVAAIWRGGHRSLARGAVECSCKKEHGIERLVVAAGRQIPAAGQIGKEMCEFLLASEGCGQGVEGGEIMA